MYDKKKIKKTPLTKEIKEIIVHKAQLLDWYGLKVTQRSLDGVQKI